MKWKEIVVTTFIIVSLGAVFSALLIPSGGGRRSSPRNACANNLRLIDAAKEQWALENGLAAGAIAVTTAIDAYLKGDTTPRCPERGVYTYGRVGEKPACSIPAHSGLY